MVSKRKKSTKSLGMPFPLRNDKHAEVVGKKVFVVAIVSILLLVAIVLFMFLWNSDRSLAGEAFRGITDGSEGAVCLDGQVCLYYLSSSTGVYSTLRDGSLSPGDSFELVLGFTPTQSYDDVAYGEIVMLYDPSVLSIDLESDVESRLALNWDIFEFEEREVDDLMEIVFVFGAHETGSTFEADIFESIASLEFTANGEDADSSASVGVSLNSASLKYYDSALLSLQEIITSFTPHTLDFELVYDPYFDSVNGELIGAEGMSLESNLGDFMIEVSGFDYDAASSDDSSATSENSDLQLGLQLYLDGEDSSTSTALDTLNSANPSVGGLYFSFDSSLSSSNYFESEIDSYIVSWPITLDSLALGVGSYDLYLEMFNDDGGSSTYMLDLDVVDGGSAYIASVNGVSPSLGSFELGTLDSSSDSLVFEIEAYDVDYDVETGLGNDDLELVVDLSLGGTSLDFLDSELGPTEGAYVSLSEISAGFFELSFIEDTSGSLLLEDGSYELIFVLMQSGGVELVSYSASFELGEIPGSSESSTDGLGGTGTETSTVDCSINSVPYFASYLPEGPLAVSSSSIATEETVTFSGIVVDDDSGDLLRATLTDVTGTGSTFEPYYVSLVSGAFTLAVDWTPTSSDLTGGSEGSNVHTFKLEVEDLCGEKLIETIEVEVVEGTDGGSSSDTSSTDGDSGSSDGGDTSDGSSTEDGSSTDADSSSYDAVSSLEVFDASESEVSTLDSMIVGEKYTFDIVIAADETDLPEEYLVLLQVVSLDTMEVELLSYQSMPLLSEGEMEELALSFIPTNGGEYLAQLFVWSDWPLNGGESLAPVLEVSS